MMVCAEALIFGHVGGAERIINISSPLSPEAGVGTPICSAACCARLNKSNNCESKASQSPSLRGPRAERTSDVASIQATAVADCSLNVSPRKRRRIVALLALPPRTVTASAMSSRDGVPEYLLSVLSHSNHSRSGPLAGTHSGMAMSPLAEPANAFLRS